MRDHPARSHLVAATVPPQVRSDQKKGGRVNRRVNHPRQVSHLDAQRRNHDVDSRCLTSCARAGLGRATFKAKMRRISKFVYLIFVCFFSEEN